MVRILQARISIPWQIAELVALLEAAARRHFRHFTVLRLAIQQTLPQRFSAHQPNDLGLPSSPNTRK